MARDVYEDHDEMSAEPRKEGLGNGLVIATTLVLVLATVLMQQALKKHFNEGFFADKKASAGGAGP